MTQSEPDSLRTVCQIGDKRLLSTTLNRRKSLCKNQILKKRVACAEACLPVLSGRVCKVIKVSFVKESGAKKWQNDL